MDGCAAAEYSRRDSYPRAPLMTNVFPLGQLRSSALVLLVALGALHVVVAGDTDPSLSAVERVQRLAQNVERAESVRAVKRVQETYAQYSQFGLWTDMAALFADNAQLSYGKDNEQGLAHDRPSPRYFQVTDFGHPRFTLKGLPHSPSTAVRE